MRKHRLNSCDYEYGHLITIYYVKCQKDLYRSFLKTVESKFVGNKWTPKKSRLSDILNARGGSVRLFSVSATTGYFDYILIAQASTAYVATEFAAKGLRSIRGAARGRSGQAAVVDIQTSISVIQSFSEFDVVETLKPLGRNLSKPKRNESSR